MCYCDLVSVGGEKEVYCVCVSDVKIHKEREMKRERQTDRHTCPRSSVTFTSLYSVLRERGGLCHHRSVPSIALVMGWARLLSAVSHVSQYWP